jgi:hypothetical protein
MVAAVSTRTNVSPKAQLNHRRPGNGRKAAEENKRESKAHSISPPTLNEKQLEKFVIRPSTSMVHSGPADIPTSTRSHLLSRLQAANLRRRRSRNSKPHLKKKKGKPSAGSGYATRWSKK